ncbi:MAG: hypothetical protein HUJ76_13115, partial [Parasporobacterium sp.]|nr:hypothetical protein [Parasporobacterium sp.]
MKKLIALMLAAVFCLSIAFTASAAQEVTVTDKNFVIVEKDYGNYGYLYARIENTGDEPLYLENGKMTLTDVNGGIAATSDYVNAYPNYLEPGQVAYAYCYCSLDVSAADCADLMFSIKPTDKVYAPTRHFEADAAEVYYDPEETWYPYNAICELTNPTEDVIFDSGVVYAFYDENDNFLFTEVTWMYNVGRIPGSPLLYQVFPDDDIAGQFTAA